MVFISSKPLLIHNHVVSTCILLSPVCSVFGKYSDPLRFLLCCPVFSPHSVSHKVKTEMYLDQSPGLWSGDWCSPDLSPKQMRPNCSVSVSSDQWIWCFFFLLLRTPMSSHVRGLHLAQIGGAVRWWLSFWTFLSSPLRLVWSRARVTIRFLVTPRTETLLIQLLSLALGQFEEVEKYELFQSKLLEWWSLLKDFVSSPSTDLCRRLLPPGGLYSDLHW